MKTLISNLLNLCKNSILGLNVRPGKFFRLVNEYERHSPVVLIDEFSVKLVDDGLDEIKMSISILVNNLSCILIQD